jgi:hypothetical protein
VSEKPVRKVYRLAVVLIGGPVTEEFMQANPVVLRTIEVRGDQTLGRLHDAIFSAFDRFEEHMYEYQFGKLPMDPKAVRYSIEVDDFLGLLDPLPPALDATEATLDSLKLRKGKIFFYWFDFGDDWWHAIKVLSIGQAEPRVRYPRVVERAGASPPQYPYTEDEGDDDEEE